MKKHPTRLLLVRIGLVLGSIFVSLLICELILTVAGYRYTPLRIEVQKKSDWRDYHIFEDSSFVSDSDLIWRPKADSAVFNSQGYRGKELPADKDRQSVRIFTIGDSNTLGWGQPNGPNWPLYLDELLRRVNDRVTVINAGVWGYSSFQGRRRFEETLQFNPDIVLISFGANDAHRVTISDADFANLGGRKLSFYLGQVTNKLRTGQLLLAASDKVFRREPDQLIPRVSLDEYKANLNEIIRVARSRNIQVVLLTRPYLGESNNEGWWMTFAPSYNDAVSQVAQAADVPWIDIYSRFRNKADSFIDESHFNEAGHRAMAELVLERIKPIVNPLLAPK